VEREKKDTILAEASRAFARHGFKKASVDDIARRAGVAKGTVYLAAESKQDLYYQVLHREVRAWVGETGAVIDPRVKADELLARLVAAATGYLERHPLVRELLFGEAAAALPGWADRFDELRVIGQGNIVEVLRLGIKQKVFREDLDVETVASLLQDLEVATYLFHTRAKDAHEQLARRGAVGLDLVLNGLRRHPGG
jgi:AcrR family transcriptional regulator